MAIDVGNSGSDSGEVVSAPRCLHGSDGLCAGCIADLTYRVKRTHEVLQAWQARAIKAEARARELEGNPGNALMFRLQRRVKHLENALHESNLREARTTDVASGVVIEVDKRA